MLVKVEQLLEPRDGNGPLTEPHRTTEATCSAEAAG
jgi:hypothetical protein